MVLLLIIGYKYLSMYIYIYIYTWSIYNIGIIVGYGIWRQLCDSFAPQGHHSRPKRGAASTKEQSKGDSGGEFRRGESKEGLYKVY